MKTIKITAIIIVSFLVGASVSQVSASVQRLIQVPEYINGYSTIELLEYVSTLKATQDKVMKEEPKKEVKTKKKGGLNTSA